MSTRCTLALAFAVLCATACGAAPSAPVSGAPEPPALSAPLPAGASAPESAPAPAQPAPASSSAAKEGAPFEMESFQLVLLRRGDRADEIPKERLEEIQKQHIAHLDKLGDAGKILIAGPFSDQPDPGLRGMCLYRVGSLEEARALAEQDPAVQAGRLRVEVMTWWVGKGYLAFPKAPKPAP